jgi:nucleotide-binding universal stress UspA family protein
MPSILLATHGGPSADGAAHVAKLLSDRLDAKLHALCIMEPLPAIDGGFGTAYVPSPDEDSAARSAMTAAAADQLRRCGSFVAPDVLLGLPGADIASAARTEGAAVIVVGLGPHQFLDRALGHETALQLVQQASTPVLAVPATMRALPRRVVAAIDFSPTSINCARFCASWLVKGDLLHLVHVTRAWSEKSSGALRKEADEALAAIASGLAVARGVTVERSIVEGEPAQELLLAATGVKAELIALGSHGYGLWKRLTIGSVASKVIRLSPVAVLVMPLGGVTS